MNGKQDEKQRIKSEMIDFLNELQSEGEIDYSCYSKIFDLSLNLLDEMYELGERK